MSQTADSISRFQLPDADPRSYPCNDCDSPVTEETEVQCETDGNYRCVECDAVHQCVGTDTCTECGKRFRRSELTLAPCACDAEWCGPCGAKHVCPTSRLGEAMDMSLHEMAERLVCQ